MQATITTEGIMLLKDIKNSHPQCYSIIRGRLSRFFENSFRVEHDKDILNDYLLNNQLEYLTFMESFYTLIRKEGRNAQKCIMSRPMLGKKYLEEEYEKRLEE